MSPRSKALNDPRSVLKKLHEPGTVFEVRMLSCKQGRRRPFTTAGYFDDPSTAAEAIQEHEGEYQPDGVYWTLNSCDPALLARSPNEMTEYLEPTTSDNDILMRRFLPLDFDPVRPAGVSSTNEELQAAVEAAQTVVAYLESQGWPQPFSGVTGNGARLLYRIDLPNDDESRDLVKSVLETLNDMFGSKRVKVDTTMYNAARIDKVFGTTARKGCDTDERPHRRAMLLYWPRRPRAVPREKLIAIAGAPTEAFATSNGKPRLKVDKWLADRGIAFKLRRKGGDAYYNLVNCPFEPDHGGKDTAIIQRADGTLGFHCFHDRCNGYGWLDVKKKLGAPASEHWKEQNDFGDIGDRGWKPIIPLGQIDLPAFPTESLPSPLREWVTAEAEATQTPADLAAMMALPVCSAAVAGKFEAKVKDGWIEPLNLWTATLLPSGNRKSAVARDADRPARQFEQDERARHARERTWTGARREKIEACIGDLQEQSSQNESMEESLGLLDEILDLRRQLESLDAPPPRLLADDSTPEKLAELLSDHGKIAIVSPEGGVFSQMAGMYNKSGLLQLDVYLKAHAGDDLVVDRIGRDSITADSPLLVLGLAVQPDVINGLYRKDTFRRRGLLARFLYAHPESPLGSREVDPPPVPENVVSDYHEMVLSLCRLSTGDDKPVDLELSARAIRVLHRFMGEIEPELGAGGEMDSIQDWGGKLAGAVVRLAGIFHLVSSVKNGKQGRPKWKNKISDSTVKAAVQIARYLVPHAQAVFDAMGSDEALDGAQHVLRWIKRYEKQLFTKRDLQQATKNRFKRVEELDGPLGLLVDHNIIRTRPQQHREGAGRPPSAVYEVNPDLGRPASGNVKTRPQNPQNRSRRREDSGDSGDRGRKSKRRRAKPKAARRKRR